MREHIDWIFGASYGTLMAVNTSLHLLDLAVQTLVVTLVAFFVKKAIENIWASGRKRIKNLKNK